MKNKKGFTLIELIATIAVIGLLLVISTGAIINGIGGAKSNITDAQKELLFSTAELYFNDNFNSHYRVDEYKVCIQNYLVRKGYITEYKDSSGNIINGTVNLSIEWDDDTIKKVKATSITEGDENICGPTSIPESCFAFSSGTITGYDVDACGTDVIIPGTIGGVAVTKIGDYAFVEDDGEGWYTGKGITSVIIPNSVTYIGDLAFAYNQLIGVEIPDNVTYIGAEAFEGNELTNIIIGSNVKEIYEGAFMDNQLEEVIIPDSVQTMCVDTFANNKLTNVVIGSGVEYLANGTFKNNPDLNDIVIKLSKEDVNSRTDIEDGWNCIVADMNTYTCTKFANIIYNPN